MKILISLLTMLVLGGCATSSKHYEGYLFCNVRYLDVTNSDYSQLGSINPEKDKRLRLAKEGYLYSLAAAESLEKKDDLEQNKFPTPHYMVRDDSITISPTVLKTGFYAETYQVFDSENPNELLELIIAFRGSDQAIDWAENLMLWQKQKTAAGQYVKQVLEVYGTRLEGVKVVASGYSLGGGLVLGVLRNFDRIDEGWAFNTSPIDGEDFGVEPRQHTLAVKGEILSWARWFPDGPASLGSYDENHTNDYDLIRINPISGHSRYILNRQLLIYADMVYFEESGRTDTSSPAMDILANAAPHTGCKDKQKAKLKEYGRL